MSSNGSSSVSRDTFIQPCNNLIRIADWCAGLHLLNLIPEVLFFNTCKGNESDAGPIPTPDSITPHYDTACLTINKLLEADHARLYRAICLDADTYDAAIDDIGMIICTHKIIKRDDAE